jgi:hypothetical protein
MLPANVELADAVFHRYHDFLQVNAAMLKLTAAEQKTTLLFVANGA